MKTVLRHARAAIAVAVLLSSAALARESAPAAEPADTAAASALANLAEGNRRFVAGTATHADQDAARRTETAKGQHPFAVILTCADSRLSPEIIFDQGIGSLFVVRNAGNIVDDHVLGSIEYAAEHLHVPVVVVLGHTKCGAIAATVAGGEAPGHIKSIVEDLADAVAMAKKKEGDAVEHAVRINAKLTAAAIAQSAPILAEAVKAGHLKVVAARYDIATGQVDFLE